MSTYNLTVGGKYITVGGYALTVGSESGTVVIGGKTYPTVVMPDGHEWLGLHLDFAWDGLSVQQEGAAVVTTPSATYYNNDEQTYGWSGNKYGLLYNWYAVNYLETNKSTLIPGWHVPTISEVTALKTALGIGQAGTKIKSTTGWYGDGNGDGSTAFNSYPAGGFIRNPETSEYYFGGLTRETYLWSSESYPQISGYSNGYSLSALNAYISDWADHADMYFSVRLVKDY